jgi:hypothetical protein
MPVACNGNPTDFAGQAHHMTAGPPHFNDSVSFSISPTGTILAFSTSLSPAFCDFGQNYKNIISVFKHMLGSELGSSYSLENVDGSCPLPAVSFLQKAKHK